MVGIRSDLLRLTGIRGTWHCWNLQSPPTKVIRNEYRLGLRVVDRAASELALRFNSDWIDRMVLDDQQMQHRMKEALVSSRIEVIRELLREHQVTLPTREELLAEARALFAATPSFDAIVDRAHDLIVRTIAVRLASPLAT
jgi:stearoyl-CoA desaturase (Delta-9 desaturase)